MFCISESHRVLNFDVRTKSHNWSPNTRRDDIPLRQAFYDRWNCFKTAWFAPRKWLMLWIFSARTPPFMKRKRKHPPFWKAIAKSCTHTVTVMRWGKPLFPTQCLLNLGKGLICLHVTVHVPVHCYFYKNERENNSIFHRTAHQTITYGVMLMLNNKMWWLCPPPPNSACITINCSTQINLSLIRKQNF